MKSSVKFSSSIPRINVGTALCLQITDMMHTKHLVRFRKTLCSVLPEVSIFPATLTWSVTLPTLEPNSPMSQLHYFISADWYLSWLSSGFKETSHGLVFSSVRHRPRLPSVSVCPLPQKVAPPLTLMQLFVTAWLKEIFGGSQKHSSFFSSSHSLFLLRSKTTPVYIYIYIYIFLYIRHPQILFAWSVNSSLARDGDRVSSGSRRIGLIQSFPKKWIKRLFQTTTVLKISQLKVF